MKKIYKLMLLSSACSFLGLQANAQQISVEEAQSRALSFLNGETETSPRKAKVSPSSLQLAYTAQSDGEQLFYVFNSTSEEGGYVIVGGDEAAQEILGYSEKGTFDYETIPANFKWFLSQYSLQIKEAIDDVKLGRATINEEARRHAANRAPKADIAQLLTTKWDQVAPYNSQIPLYAKGFTGQSALATGCVATAAAQVMKYHNWPDHGVGQHTLNRTINGITFSADFENTTYDWANMQNSYAYDTYTGSAADIAVGTLMYHVGVAVDMEYGQLSAGGSGAANHTLAIRLADTFRYNKGIRYERRSSYSDQDWEDIVYAELAASRPVIYGGQSDAPGGGGHAFVCDGYTSGRYHINWGWSGNYNGNFLLTATSTEKALQPDGTGSGGSASGSSYSLDQEIIINVKPDRTGTSQPERRIYAEAYTLPDAQVAKGGRTYINGMMWNYGLFTETFDFAVKLVNTVDETEVHVVESESPFVIKPNQGRGYVYYQIPDDVSYGASYYVYPMFKNNNDEWQLAELPRDFVVPSLQIESPTGLNVEEFAVSNNGYISEESCEIAFELKNWGSASVSAPIILWVFPQGGGSSVDYIDLGTVALESMESKHFDLTYNDFYIKDDFVPGSKYFFKAYNRSSGSYISSNVNFTFCNDLNIDYNITSAEWSTLCLPFNAAVPAGCTAYTVTGVNGSALVKEEAEKLEMNKPYLITGHAGTYQFSGPDTPTSTGYKNGILYGNTAPSTDAEPCYAPAGSYVLQKHGEEVGFYHVDAADTQKIRQYSAYLSVGGLSSASAFIISEDESTAIESVQTVTDDAPAFNLNGVRVENHVKGMVIVNGRLIYNK